MTKWERRIRRERQQKYRKLGPGPTTILENTQVVLCVMYGLITEAEGAKTLRVDIREFGRIALSVISLANVVAGKLAEESPCQPN
jgi:hypothetical protein